MYCLIGFKHLGHSWAWFNNSVALLTVAKYSHCAWGVALQRWKIQNHLRYQLRPAVFFLPFLSLFSFCCCCLVGWFWFCVCLCIYLFGFALLCFGLGENSKSLLLIWYWTWAYTSYDFRYSFMNEDTKAQGVWVTVYWNSWVRELDLNPIPMFPFVQCLFHVTALPHIFHLGEI